jgi:hypothetical protein
LGQSAVIEQAAGKVLREFSDFCELRDRPEARALR